MTKIVIFGDSYTIDSDRNYSYINRLRKDYQVETLGIAGTSNWNIALSIINYQQDFDIAIVFWTMPYRLYHPSYCLTLTTIKNVVPSNRDEREAFRAAESFHQRLFFKDKEDFAFICLLHWIDDYFKEKFPDKKIINGWAFSKVNSEKTLFDDTISNPTFHYRFSNGVEIRPSLSYLTYSNGEDAINHESLINHLSESDHLIVYNTLVNAIDNYEDNKILDFRKL